MRSVWMMFTALFLEKTDVIMGAFLGLNWC